MILANALKEARDLLSQAGINDFNTDAEILLEYVTGYDHTTLILKRSEDIAEEAYLSYQELVRRRAEHIPVQYLTGNQEFMGLSFTVDKNVLIPRQDTEILVMEACKYTEGKNVLDMCTGSGCIIISVIKLGKAIGGTGVDISSAALEIAKKNAQDNNVQVVFIQSDMFNKVCGRYDVIVSNPPYVTEEELNTLEPEVKLHEPRLALYGAENGLAFYRILAEKGKNHLEKNGRLIVEIGCNQAAEVSEIFAANGYKDIKVIKDLAGLDRVVSAMI